MKDSTFKGPIPGKTVLPEKTITEPSKEPDSAAAGKEAPKESAPAAVGKEPPKKSAPTTAGKEPPKESVPAATGKENPKKPAPATAPPAHDTPTVTPPAQDTPEGKDPDSAYNVLIEGKTSLGWFGRNLTPLQMKEKIIEICTHAVMWGRVGVKHEHGKPPQNKIKPYLGKVR